MCLREMSNKAQVFGLIGLAILGSGAYFYIEYYKKIKTEAKQNLKKHVREFYYLNKISRKHPTQTNRLNQLKENIKLANHDNTKSPIRLTGKTRRQHSHIVIIG